MNSNQSPHRYAFARRFTQPATTRTRGMARALLVAIVLMLGLFVTAQAIPVQPTNFYGTVLRDGANVPSGTVITAWVAGVDDAVGTTTSFLYEGTSVYNLNVIGDDTDTPEKDGCTVGETITLRVDGQLVPQTGICQIGASSERNLTAPASAVPALTTVSPDVGDRSTTLNVTLTSANTGFINGVTTADFGSGITVNSVSVASANSATANITIAAGATTGLRTVSVTTNAETVSLNSAFTVRGESVDIYLPLSAGGPTNAEVMVPLTAPSSLSGLSIISYQFTLTYDPAVLDPVEVSTADTLSAGWSITSNPDTPGEWTVIVYDADSALSGSGTLINLKFLIVGESSDQSALDFSDFELNNGGPAVTTHAGSFAVTGITVSGNATYADSGEAVGSVNLALTGTPGNQNGTTNASGAFQLGVSVVGNYTLTPSKTQDRRGAISALDASVVARCAAGLLAIANCPGVTSDANEDGRIRGYDAALIARFAVGLTTPASRVGQWAFAPPNRSVVVDTSNVGGQNFLAYLVGDVTGDWAAGVQADGLAADGATRVNAQALNTGADGTESLSLALENPPRNEVFALYMEFTYNGDTWTFAGVESAGMLTDGWNWEANTIEPGIVRLAGYHTHAVTQNGPLLRLAFHPTAENPGPVGVAIGTLDLNEGESATIITESGFDLYMPLQMQ